MKIKKRHEKELAEWNTTRFKVFMAGMVLFTLAAFAFLIQESNRTPEERAQIFANLVLRVNNVDELCSADYSGNYSGSKESAEGYTEFSFRISCTEGNSRFSSKNPTIIVVCGENHCRLKEEIKQ